MSYGAVGDGWLVLRFDSQAKSSLKAGMCARYDELCRTEQNQPGMDMLRELILQTYEAKKKALELKGPSDWLKKEFSEIGFSDASANEDPAQETLYIEMSFDGKYYEDRIMGLLNTLVPFTVEGEFSFRGEDDELWRLQFTGADWNDERGEIIYTDKNAAAERGEGPYPDLIEDVGTFEALLSEVEARFKSDDRPAPQRGRQLMTAFQNQDPDGVLLALTGWSLRSLGALAGIWQGIVPK